MGEPADPPLKHRDLNWLSFNKRVLQEAEDQRNPLYERIKFLAIFSSNLDEFFRVRVSQLRQIKRVKKSLRKKLALKPNRITREILKEVKQQQEYFGTIYHQQILPELASHGIHLITSGQFDQDQKQFSKDFFLKKLQSELRPKLLDLKKQNKLFLENALLYFIISFKDPDFLGVVDLPVVSFGRFIALGQRKEDHYLTFLDEILRSQLDKVFPGQQIQGIYEVKLSRDAELYIEDQYEGVLAEKIYESLAQRSKGQPTRLLYDARMPQKLQERIRKLLGLGKIDMVPGGKYHNFKDFFAFPEPTGNPDLFFQEQEPVKHRVLEESRDYFQSIKEKDQAVHFPYMSFTYVENFMGQAARDPQVSEISISLYRIADESPLTSCLLKALDNGKKVTVFVEAKARFDEENNIIWGRKFEEKGAHVIYSYPRIKVHSKILLVRRLEENVPVDYAYIGTGNFNSETSEIYADHALFTANPVITGELGRLFKVLEGKLIIPRDQLLLISPFSTRERFQRLIYREIENARQGKPAGITAKMNSLEDQEIIRLLYRASQSGVRIRLLVRGFTCFIPGLPGHSENAYITSIVDRYLEHGRIYRFENAGDPELYFGSADWMNRNLDRRIEVIAPILDKDIAREFQEILDIQLKDNVKARIQDKEESNRYVKRASGEKAIRSQWAIYNYLKNQHQK